jgi:hypothetical protein
MNDAFSGPAPDDMSQAGVDVAVVDNKDYAAQFYEVERDIRAVVVWPNGTVAATVGTVTADGLAHACCGRVRLHAVEAVGMHWTMHAYHVSKRLELRVIDQLYVRASDNLELAGITYT